MSDSEDKPRLFGTNGIRGIPNRDLNVEFCENVGKAIGSYLNAEEIVMGKDTRISGDMIVAAVAAGIMSTGTKVVDLGILPTPAIQYFCKRNEKFGVVITASHNPPQFNGIKCIHKDGTEMPRSEEENIERTFYNEEFKDAEWQSIGTYSNYSSAVEEYIQGVMSMVDSKLIREKHYRVAVDTGNGASFRSTPELLRRLGCSVVTLNANPDGTFSARPSEPKPENLGSITSLMKSGGFVAGFAHDGDADRTVVIDEYGEFIDGDKTLALITKNVARKGDIVVTPISSSDSITDVCAEAGAKLLRTRVGAPIVSRTMIENHARIGGEENGGIIFGAHQYCRDGAMTVALFLELMARTGKHPSELIKDIPQYFLVKKSVELEIPWKEIRTLLLEKLDHEVTDLMDGIKIVRDNGWVLIRPSGTEPIVRVYAQSKKLKTATELENEFVDLVMASNSGK
ncbi:putative phosphoglucosamine mutase [Thermoplasmatales archaeon]|nr:putative phosphoglucosamine mutase [Thermoplasmatales archaeon]